MLFTSKKDSELHLCIDYRDINNITIKNRYSLFLLSDTLDCLSNSAIYIKLDLCDVYHWIWIKKFNQWKIIFHTRYEHYEYRIMSFDFVNTFVMFQVYINNTLHDLLNICCVVYLNNILIYLSFKEQHETDVLTILKHLSQTQLFIKLNKCKFEIIKVFFLNYMIRFESVKMKLNWIKIIEEWSLSCSMKKVQFFLRFMNFYCRFIRNYFKIAALLHELIKNAKKEEWRSFFVLTDTAKDAFNILKAKFTNVLLFTHFNLNKWIHIKSDTSDAAVIIIISQLINDELWHFIAY